MLLCTAVSAQVSTVPTPAMANAPVTLNFNKTGTPLAGYSGTIYAHIGLTVDGAQWQYVIGDWGDNLVQPALAHLSGNNYRLEITPDLYSYFGVPATSTITQICVVFRAASGSPQTVDYFLNVGSFHLNLTSPLVNSTSLVPMGGSLLVEANNTGGAATYELFANGALLHTSAATSNFSFSHTGIVAHQQYELVVTQGDAMLSRSFSAIVMPSTQIVALPGNLVEGINYHSSDPTKATLVLDAPGKDHVYVAGSFNNYSPSSAYAMRKDPASTKFWLELENLMPQTNYTYQYWVMDATPPVGSPALVKTADPFSTLVLSPFDDPYISAGTYPDLPAYPQGQSREVTVLKTGQTPYPWQVTNFEKPKKEDLVVYELLVRDFGPNRNFQDLIDRIDYFKSLNINAIQLMPVMEFEGNESWGYNTSFHMALDKFYGTSDKFKEFVDLCHQNGIAVILDVALNHAFGRNPLVRMWMKDPDGDGWGDPHPSSPYFNEFPKHAYNVGADFNHQSTYTQQYVKRVVQHWIEEYKIDGFRWDLTKGFTQNCSASNESCTNSPQSDRIAVLKTYADHSWALDPTHYVIFEHLGSDAEEQQWANYRLNESPSKGVIMWAELTYPYAQLIMGYASGADISRMGHTAHGFQGKRVMGYPESHDKERLMYSAMTYGASTGEAPPFQNFENAIQRMASVAATSLLVPGPKMMWHFAELGYSDSIYTCADGSVNTESDATPGDCKLDTKPQQQWTQNWPDQPLRAALLADYKHLIDLKINEPVFEGNYSITTQGSNLRQRIAVWDDGLDAETLSHVIVLANFETNAQNLSPNFPTPGQWVDLMTNEPFVVTDVAAPIGMAAGSYRVFGNRPASLGVPVAQHRTNLALYPNPSADGFALNQAADLIQVYALSGQLVQTHGSLASGMSVETQTLSPGIYLVRVLNSSGVKTLKWIKQ